LAFGEEAADKASRRAFTARVGLALLLGGLSPASVQQGELVFLPGGMR